MSQGMKYSIDQQKVIDTRDCNILVSAAAGSGKTAVLVERIIHLISEGEKPLDIDRLLVVTFTNAAAAEMRERVHKAILDKCEHEPDNAHLKKQSILVHHAQITTIDSFCRFILMNHFGEIDLDPGFQIGEPGKIKLMKKDAMAKVMELAYANETPEFLDFANAFSKNGKDKQIEEMIEQIFGFVMSQPFPDKWLDQVEADYALLESDQHTMHPLFDEICAYARDEVTRFAHRYEMALKMLELPGAPEQYVPGFQNEYEQITLLRDAADFSALASGLRALDNWYSNNRIATVRKGTCDDTLKEQIKSVRDETKKYVNTLVKSYFYASWEDILEDLVKCRSHVQVLLGLTRSYMEQFAADKRRENIVDFSDMEHFALQILVDEDGNPTDVARLYQDFYQQVMIDEYQDSNEVQEMLLSVVSRSGGTHPDRFMVGDMKQSIYKFRMACPEIFLEKYHTYEMDSECGAQNVRIDLKENYRSRKQVIDFANTVFYPLMQESLGGIAYDESARLYPKATYVESETDDETYCPEFLIFDQNREDALDEAGNQEGRREIGGLDASEDVDGDADGALSGTALEGEARMIARRIKELMADTKVYDKDAKTMRPMTYSDIAILYRSGAEVADTFKRVLKSEGIPVVSPSETGYFAASEVQILLSMLQVISNPQDDIALAAVLKSPLFGFDDAGLAKISLHELPEGVRASLYNKLAAANDEKSVSFVEELQKLRQMSKHMSVHDLLYQIVIDHGYMHYVTALPAGHVRGENVKMLLQRALVYEQSQMHGLFGFLQYMSLLQKYEIDYGETGYSGEEHVTVMTIHKSKGLEFPVCFISGLAKRFNESDYRKSMVLHKELGVGIEYRSYEKRFYRKTILHRMIVEKQHEENMAEELRILYVALTRPREKCILTGFVKDFDKLSEKMDAEVDVLRKLPLAERVIDKKTVCASKNFLEILLLVERLYQDVKDNGLSDKLNLRLPKMQVFGMEELKVMEQGASLDRALKKEALLSLGTLKGDAILSKINHPYGHESLKGLYVKTSVSELKMAAIHEDEQTMPMFETEVETSIVPKFMQAKEEVKGARRGSAYHRVMELLDFSAFACDKSEYPSVLANQKAWILSNSKMDASELELVDDKKVIAFFESDLGQEMIKANREGCLFKEQPYVMEVEATRVNPDFLADEKMLVQGIIDAYYIKDGQIVLMDYKTDRVSHKKDLIDRYQVQLDLYQQALERILKMPVSETKIYSFYYSESISVADFANAR